MKKIVSLTEKELMELYTVCLKFIIQNKIYCPETIYQGDRVIDNAYGLIKNICDIVGYEEYDEDHD
jgi:hypothetical protein